jgi:NAD(P)-dependent dehydrogenase (short-subunit alcohol dehydrogenase family)
MTFDLTGKVALVTGGGNGIGAACCRVLAVNGARIAVVDRDGAAAERVAREIGGGASAHALDVSDVEAFKRLADEIAAKAGGIGILLNSAGTITRQMIAAMPTADWDRVVAVNAVCPDPTATGFGGGQLPRPSSAQGGRTRSR